jgi:23S rRNA pseudouridine1911/1915/1917 synthase
MPLPPVILEDDALIVFDKPSGMPVVPDPTEKSRESLVPLVRAKFGPDAANVHRLDREASGVLLCAKTKPALDFLSGQFQSKTAERKYFALVVVLPLEAMKPQASVRDVAGALPDVFTIDLPLGEDQHVRGRMRVMKGRGGKESVTVFRVLERFGRFAWLQCQPLSGRPHQLRVHLAAARLPVLNDALYGDPDTQLLLSDLKRGYKGRDAEKPLINRLALHASELGLKHPATRESFTVAASLPHDLEIALKFLRKFPPGRVSRIS